MVSLTEDQKREATELWKKKISTIEYRALELCGNIIEGYQRRLERYEGDLDAQNIPVRWPDYSTDREGLHNSIISLQLLLGLGGLPRDCQSPRTLETALYDAGMDKENVDTEVNRGEGYLTRAEQLDQKAGDLFEREINLTIEVLTAKKRKGEPLTPEEEEALERVYDILADDH